MVLSQWETLIFGKQSPGIMMLMPQYIIPKLVSLRSDTSTKKLDGVIVNATNFIKSDEMADSLGLPPSLDPNWTSFADRRVRRPENIDESTIKGFEIEYQTNFSYLPWPFKGLVINANYTRIFSETKFSTFRNRNRNSY